MAGEARAREPSMRQASAAHSAEVCAGESLTIRASTFSAPPIDAASDAATGAARSAAGGGFVARVMRSCCRCCRRRRTSASDEREMAELAIGNRLDRLLMLQHLQEEADLRQLQIWRQSLSRRQLCRRRLRSQLQRWQEQAANSRCFVPCDSVTGLPKKLLRELELVETVAKGPHGVVFKARRRSAAPGERQWCAVRVRDKSLGKVLLLPLRQTAAVLRAEVLNAPRSRVRRLLTALGLGGATFHSRFLVDQLMVYNTQELFIEVTEWCEGGSLTTRLQEKMGALDEYTACGIAKRVLMALVHMHDRGLLHRSVRLAQVMLPQANSFDDAKLGDLWCTAKAPKTGVVVDGAMPIYLDSIAPEVLTSGTWSAKSDMWALGCLIFELLFGHPAFGGEGNELARCILQGKVEFDTYCGSVSSSATDLLTSLLDPSPDNRPSADDTTEHAWFAEFGNSRKRARSVSRQIRDVRIAGNPPLCRKGLPAESLLDSSSGLLGSGFCSYMGSTVVNIDFDIGGGGETDEGDDYWVSSILVSLWGRGENPRMIILQAPSRSGSSFVDVAFHQVESEQSTQALLEVNVPLRRARLALRKNFGGIFGVALRKVTFSGYRMCAAPVCASFNECVFSRGATVHTHSSEIVQASLDQAVHKSLHSALEVGARIPDHNSRYRVYKDIRSGAPHHSSSVQLQPLEPIAAARFTAASLDLRYVSDCPRQQTAPCAKVLLVRTAEAEGGEVVEKHLLFVTEALPPPEWTPDRILGRGYADIPPLFATGFDFDAEDDLHIEVQFSNHSGYVHIPADFGLKLYYCPHADAGDSSDSEAGRLARRRAAGKMVDQTSSDSVEEVVQKKAWQEDDILSEHPVSEGVEEQLRGDMQEMLREGFFGRTGPARPYREEMPCWHPMVEAEAEAEAIAAARGVQPGGFWWDASLGTPPTSDEWASEGSRDDEQHKAGWPSSAGWTSGAGWPSSAGWTSGAKESWSHDGKDHDKGEIGDIVGAGVAAETSPHINVLALAAKRKQVLRQQALDMVAGRAAVREAKALEALQEGLGESTMPCGLPPPPLWCAPPRREFEQCSALVNPISRCAVAEPPPSAPVVDAP